MSRIGKVFSIEWGANADQAGTRLGLACKQWQEWPGGQGFEVCYDPGSTVNLLGKAVNAGLIRLGDALHGVELLFSGCKGEWTELREAVRDQLDLVETDTTDLYQVCLDGEVVRFVPSASGDSCRLTLASPAFGKVYMGYSLAKGFGDIAAAMLRH